MNCSDFQQLIAERVAGELSPAQKQDMDEHEQSCPDCRRAVETWQQLESLLRGSWPAEDPHVSFFLPNRQRPVQWLETARNWFGLASMAAVTACLLLLVILHPSVSLHRGNLSINFVRKGAETAAVATSAVTQAQVEAWVQQAVAQAAPQPASTVEQTSGAKGIPSNEEVARSMTQMGVQLEMLKLNQASLWQQVEQHGLYLQSAWRSPSEELDVPQKQNSDRP